METTDCVRLQDYYNEKERERERENKGGGGGDEIN